ncbi:MAG: recombinase family protein [bacterium]|nr:recombinase family protein [bacterium]
MQSKKEVRKEVQDYKKAVVYVRVATSQEKENDLLAQQEAECREYATSKGLITAHVFSEVAGGSEEDEREALQEMFEFIADEKNKVSAVVVSSSDRLSRDAVQYWRIAEELNRLGVHLVIALKSPFRV